MISDRRPILNCLNLRLRLKELDPFSRKPSWAPGAIDHGRFYDSGDQKIIVAFDGLRHFNPCTGYFGRAGLDGQYVVNARRRLEVDLHAPHHPDVAFTEFAICKLRMVDAKQTQVIRTPPLQEFEITGMVNNAGKIRIGIIDTCQ